MNNTENSAMEMDLDLAKTTTTSVKTQSSQEVVQQAKSDPVVELIQVEPQVIGQRRGRRPSVIKVRKALGLTQVELAKKLRVTQAMVSMVESGKAKPGPKLSSRIEKLRVKAA